MTSKTPYEHFIMKVEKTDSCWLWKAYVAISGYATFKSGGKMHLAHRFSYKLFKGDILDGLQIDHLCRVRHCVNPDHLEAVTARENMHRGDTLAAGNIVKTECPRGHKYSSINTYRWRRHRVCRECHAAAQKKYLEKRVVT